MLLDTYLLFAVTTLVISFTPGAAAITVASQGATNGGRRALFGAAGVVWGNVIYFILSATGIASLIIASHTLFSIIKWVGVAYLIFLGGYAIFSKSGAIKIGADKKKSRYRTMFIKGFVIELANPKALLYFAAVIPQFIDTNSPIAIQFLIMGITTFFLDCLAYSSYAFLGDQLTRGGMKKWVVSAVNKTAGTALIFAGIKMATVSANN